ncbi:retrovirus-related pol polyprotein from transposon TNT 1-94 [Tanacetum coccineum]|uniref:Retrovirus-related pol polyprotein from transposon TNT 1-94 n=1 Tax=Tanacetum coccineum TaxID=301880 RepID=A0ABQ5BZI0_9ASTR
MEVVWMRKSIDGLGNVVPTNKRHMKMLCDNTSAITIANDPKIIKGAKNYQWKYHYIHEVIQNGEIVLNKVHTDDNITDLLTKLMPYTKHYEDAMGIEVHPASSLMLVKLLVLTYVSVAMYGLCVICVCVGYVRLDNQSIERDHLIGIGFVLDFVEFISFTFGDKEMISVIESVSRSLFDASSLLTLEAKNDALKALSRIIDPDFGTDIVSCGFVKDLDVDDISGEIEKHANEVVAALPCVQNVKFEISSWRGARVDVRTYLLGGAIDGSEANGIIRDPKLELESSRFTFDLVPLSYESVDVVVGENWLLRHKAEMVCHEKVVKMPCVPKELVGFTPRRRIGFRMELVQGATPICEGSCRLTSLERQEVWNDCRSCKVRVGSNGNLLWEASVLLGRKKGCVMDMLKFTAMPFGLTNAPTVFMELMSQSKEEYESHVKMIVESLKEEKMYVKFSNNVEAEQRGSYLDVEGIKWMLYRGVGRSSEAKNEFEIDVRRSNPEMENGSYWLDKVRTSIWRDVRTLAIEEAYTTKYSIHPGADTMLCGFRTSMVDFRGNWNTHFREMSFSLRWGLSFEYGCASFEAWYGKELDNQSIERDRLIGIGFVLDFVEFISLTFGDKEMILVIEAVLR